MADANPQAFPGFFARLALAWKILFSPDLALALLKLIGQGPGGASTTTTNALPQKPPVEPPPQKPPEKPADKPGPTVVDKQVEKQVDKPAAAVDETGAALHMLSIFQRDGRLLDF